MKTQRYQLRISGLSEGEGQIRMTTLRRVTDALLTTAERATRLIATGVGVGKGARPQWLDASIDFTITGLKSGSTVIQLEAPRLGDTAHEQFTQDDLWRKQPSLDDTALDLVAEAVNETQLDKPAGDYFDTSVLDAVLRFGKAAGVAGVRYEMVPQDATHGHFALDDSTCIGVRDRLSDIPEPRSFIVSGRLDEIKHGNGRFRLVVGQGAALFGRVNPTSLDVEALRPLWGMHTTVEGIVHFKVNGQPRLIEARRISSRQRGDNVFEEMPTVDVEDSPDLFPVPRKEANAFDPIQLAGAWPGDEPIEQLLAQLD